MKYVEKYGTAGRDGDDNTKRRRKIWFAAG